MEKTKNVSVEVWFRMDLEVPVDATEEDIEHLIYSCVRFNDKALDGDEEAIECQCHNEEILNFEINMEEEEEE